MNQRRAIPPDGVPDHPNDVNQMLLEDSLSLNYRELRNLQTVSEQRSPVQEQIDTLLSRDLLNISLKERNAINEEIHGVQTIAPEESPSMIQAALLDLYGCMETMPSKEKVAYLRSQELNPDTYINGSDFRLRFLRCDLFDVEKAAARMANFLDLMLDLFGDCVLKRPLQISDFSWEEMQVFRHGHFQLLPYRDRSGRRIFAFVGGFAIDMPLATKVKILIYLMLAASDDVETQRRGICSIVLPGVKCKTQKEPDSVSLNRIVFMKRVYSSLPIRTASIHFCLPNTHYSNLFRTIFILTMPSFRKRMKFHIGESVEVLYILKGYGIPTELIPLTDTGNIKTIYLKQWIKLRKTLDSINEKGHFIATLNSIIECPGSKDVVFRPGTSALCHPGNVRFRNLLESITFPSVVMFKITQAEMAEQLIRDIKDSGGRFLRWDNNGYWTEIRDKLQIHTKVALSIRDFKYKFRAQRKNRQHNQSYTYLFCQDGSKRKRDDADTEDGTPETTNSDGQMDRSNG